MKNRIRAALAALRGRPVMYRMNAHGDFRIGASVGYFGQPFLAENWYTPRKGSGPSLMPERTDARP